MLLVQSVWEGVKANDRVLTIFPDVRFISSIPSQIVQEFRKTLQAMIKASPKYIVCLFPHSLPEFLIYEQLYGMEFQQIDNIDVFDDPDFQRFLTPHKLYYLNQSISTTLHALTQTSFDQIIIDDLEFPKEEFEYLKEKTLPYTIGKNYSEEIINSKMYLGKVIQQMIHPFRSSFEEEDYDVVLILGNCLKPSIQEYESILIDYMKECRLTAIYASNKDDLSMIRSWIQSLKIKLPTTLLSTPWTSSSYSCFMKKLKSHSVRYTSFLWLGSFEFGSKDIYSKWVKDRESYKQISVFDMDAIHTLVQKDYHEESGYRLTLQPKGLLRSYLSMSSSENSIHLPPPPPSKEEDTASTEE